MGPFQFETYHNPYVQSISSLMMAPAQAQAGAAQQIGEAQARAALQRGQAWGGALNTVGQIAATLPGQIQRAQQQGTVDQIAQLRLQDAQREQAGGKAVAGLMEGDQLPAGEAGPRKESFLDSSGLFDISKLTKALGAAGFGDKAPELLKGAENINASIQSHQQAQQQLAKEHTVLLGDIASGAQALAITGVPLDQALDFVAQPAVATGRINPDEYAQAKQQLLRLPPEQQKAALNNLMDQAAKIAPTKTLAEGAKETDRYGRVIAVGDKKPPTPASIALDAAGGDPVKANDLLHPKPKLDLQAKPDMVIKGTTNVPSYNPATGGWEFDGKSVPADQVVRAAPPKDPVAIALQQIALQTAKQNLSDKQKRDANINAIAEGMESGDIPPDPEGLSRQGIYADVVGKMAQDGVNFSELRKNWLATKRLVVTENSPQSNRLDIAVRSGLKMYDAVDALSSQWEGMGLGPLSRANLKLATEGAKGPAAASLAIQLNGQIAQLTSDIATVEQNGMTPTQESRDVAAQSMQSWWGNQTIKAMTAQGRANMKIREAARNESVPLAPGQTTPQQTAPAAPAAPDRVKAALSGKGAGRYTLSDGSQWVIDGTGTIRPGS